MKVTVCFDSVRLLVPCANGDLRVRDLIEEAVRRYKKAIEKDVNSRIHVSHLSTQSGILDPDDCVRDVVDDREEIFASFEDLSTNLNKKPSGNYLTQSGFTDDALETRCAELRLGAQMRRDSDTSVLFNTKTKIANKRFSAEVSRFAIDSLDHWHQLKTETGNGPVQRQQKRIAYGRQRLSDGSGYILMDAADRMQSARRTPQQIFQRSSRLMDLQLDIDMERVLAWNKEQQQQMGFQQQFNYQQQQYTPHTQSYLMPHSTLQQGSLIFQEFKSKQPSEQVYETMSRPVGEMLLILNDHSDRLSFTATPDKESGGGGILVRYVQPGSRADRGRLRLGDRILEINGKNLVGLTENEIQEQLRLALHSPELRVYVVRGNQQEHKLSHRDLKAVERNNSFRVATVLPNCKSPTKSQIPTIEQKFEIVLTKGAEGLGFSVTSPDNCADSQSPIYIKKFMAFGAAIEDGRLKPGDRLIEIDGLPLSGKTYAEVVSILRGVPTGAEVRLIVSRKEDFKMTSQAHRKENKWNCSPEKAISDVGTPL